MIFKGNKNIEELCFRGKVISEGYKGSVLVYRSGIPSGTILFESAVPGTYQITTDKDYIVRIDLVGGGGGGTYSGGSHSTGGSAAYISGTMQLNAGTHIIIIGAGGVGYHRRDGQNGGNSSFSGNTAGGGYGADFISSFPDLTADGNGGTYSIVSTGLSGNNGIIGSSVGWINGYGAGSRNATIARSGYCKIVVEGRA